MRRETVPASTAPGTPPGAGADFRTLKKLAALCLAVALARAAWRCRSWSAAKLANVGVPLVLKHLVDALDLKPGDPRAALVVPVGLLLAYGALRLSITLFTELREFLFYPVAARIARRVSLETFDHLLSLSLRFHLERQTGGVSRDIERGSRSIQSLLNFTIYNILPTLVEITLVIVLLSTKFDVWFAAIVFGALVLYIGFTVTVTEWRTHFRRAMNEQDSKANTKAVDALINYETVKYFSNERFEQARYDENLHGLEKVSIKSQTSLSLLNLGQSLHHRRHGDAAGVAGDARRRRRHDDARRPGAGQRADDPALHPAELPRRDLPRDQAVADRPGEDVRAARREPRDRRRRRCRAAGGCRRRARCDGALRQCPLRLRPRPDDPARRELRDSGRQEGRGGRPLGVRQEHAGAAAVPLLRRRRRHASRSTARTSAALPSRACAERSASSRRTPCSSTTRSNTTSPMAAPGPALPRSRVRPARPISTRSSPPRPRATTRWSESAG